MREVRLAEVVAGYRGLASDGRFYRAAIAASMAFLDGHARTCPVIQKFSRTGRDDAEIRRRLMQVGMAGIGSTCMLACCNGLRDRSPGFDVLCAVCRACDDYSTSDRFPDARKSLLCVLGPRLKELPPTGIMDRRSLSRLLVDGRDVLADFLDGKGDTGAAAAAHLRDDFVHSDGCWLDEWLLAEVFSL